MKFLRFFAAILTMLFPFASFSQEAKPTKQASSLRSVQLLDHARRLGDDARGLNPADEIPLQARLADVVWDSDQSLAVRLLSRSFELTIGLLQDPPRADSASSSPDPHVLFAEISSIAAKHDEKLEKKLNERWQEAVAAVVEKGIESKSDPTQMAGLLLWQARNYLKSDQQKARQLFRQSVSLRVLPDHCGFLVEQRQQTTGIADVLFSDAIDVLAQRPLAEANELLMLSSYLFSADGGIGYIGIAGYNTANVAANMSAVPKNSALAKRYLTLLLAKVTANELLPPAVAHFALKNFLPQYQSLAPELLTDVYAQMATLLPSVSKEDAALFDKSNKESLASESEQRAEMDKRLEKADKIENDDLRDWEYFGMIFGYLLPNKDFTRALSAVSKITNQDLKEKSTDVVNLTVLQAKLEKPETAASVSESDFNKLKTALVRVMGLSILGQARLKQKATGEALRLFTQAAGEAAQIKEEQDRLQAKLVLVQLFLDADATAGFEQAAEAFKGINQFSDFEPGQSAFLLKVTTYGLKNLLDVPSPAPASLWSTVAKMCRANCEETFQTAGRLEKKELKLWSTFVAVQTGLRENSPQSNAGSHN